MMVPYAAKAGDAETLGGLPASAFMRGAASAGAIPVVSVGTPPPAPNTALSGGGIPNFVPLWTPDGKTQGDSILYLSGTGSSPMTGTIKTSPALPTLDVRGVLDGPSRINLSLNRFGSRLTPRQPEG